MQLPRGPVAVEWKDDRCVLLDQTRLPSEEVFVVCTQYCEVVDNIKSLVVRGAPAIGVAAAYGVVLACQQALELAPADRVTFFERALSEISQARPTAVNLAWAVERMREAWENADRLLSAETRNGLLKAAQSIHAEDIENNCRMATLGASLLARASVVMTYCNAGALATGGVGTALGVICEGFRQGKVRSVFVCETRPLLQGMRLTTWELHSAGVPYTLICDNTAASVLSSRQVQAVIVGADRISSSGDAANKVGTLSLALAARHYDVPFYVVAPTSSFDSCLESGSQIPIEERSGLEVTSILGANKPPYPVAVYSPAFDVTPHALISAIVCEKGIIDSPSASAVQSLLNS